MGSTLIWARSLRAPDFVRCVFLFVGFERLTIDVDEVQGVGSRGGGRAPVDGAVGEVEGCGAVGGGTGEDGFAVEGVWDDTAADGEVEIVVGAVGGAGGLQVEELVGWGGEGRGG